MAYGLPVVRVFLRGIPTFLAKNMNQMHLNKGLVPSADGIGTYYFGDATKANPYNYGHLPEIVVNKDGSGTAKKHFCL